MQTFTVRPIDPTVVAELRVRDDAGRLPQPIVDDEGGSPLRCCLRLSRPGERLLLTSYAPLRRWAQSVSVDPVAYDEVGPVFIHARACDGAASDGYPDDMRGTPRVFRAYDANGRIVGGQMIAEGEEPEPVLAALFDDPAVAFVHARAVVYGCFTFVIGRC